VLQSRVPRDFLLSRVEVAFRQACH
jgi:hypothetical protein